MAEEKQRTATRERKTETPRNIDRLINQSIGSEKGRF